MKKTIALAIALIMALTLATCGGNNDTPSGRDNAPSGTDNPPGTTQGGNNGGGNGETSGGAHSETVTLAYAPPAVGDYIYFGDYDWQILDIQDGKALLLGNYVLENRAYHNEGAETIDDLEIATWESCDLRAYLNGEFYSSFSADDRAKIITVTNQNPDNPWLGTDGGADTQDNIFILSLDEVVKYLSFDVGEMQNQLQNGNPLSTDDEPIEWISDGFLGEQARQANRIDAPSYGNFDNAWWLRSPGFDATYAICDEYCASFVRWEGTVSVAGNYTTGTDFIYVRQRGTLVSEGDSNISVRPAMWITLDTPGGGGGETPSYAERTERGNTVFNNLNGGIAAEKDGWIYYVEQKGTNLMSVHPHFLLCKIRPDGSERTELIADDIWEQEENGRIKIFDFLNESPYNLNVVGDWVYFTLDNVSELVYNEQSGWREDRGGHYVCKVRTDGTGGDFVLRKGDSSQQIIFTDGVYAPSTPYYHDTMTVVGDWIYYIRATESGEGNGLYKVRTDGTQDTLLVKGDAVWRVSVVGDWIFYMLKGEAYRVRTDGAQRTKIKIDYYIECMHYWEDDSEVMGEMYYFTITDMMVDGEHMYLLGSRSGSNWYRFDMDNRNEVRLNYRGEFFNVSEGWLYYVGQIEDQNHKGLFRSRLDSAQTVMADGWSSPQIDVGADGTLLSELPVSNSQYDLRIAALGDWLFCENGDNSGKIRTDGTEYEDISGQLFSKWGVQKISTWRYVDDQALEGASDRIIEMEINKGVYAPGETITVTINGITQEMADDSVYVGISERYPDEILDCSYPTAGNSTLTLTAPNEEGAYRIGLITLDFVGGEYIPGFFVMLDFAVDSSG